MWGSTIAWQLAPRLVGFGSSLGWEASSYPGRKDMLSEFESGDSGHLQKSGTQLFAQRFSWHLEKDRQALLFETSSLEFEFSLKPSLSPWIHGLFTEEKKSQHCVDPSVISGTHCHQTGRLPRYAEDGGSTTILTFAKTYTLLGMRRDDLIECYSFLKTYLI